MAIWRFAAQLIELDCWYSWYLSTEPILRPGSIYILQPSSDVPFRARTLEEWSRTRPDFPNTMDKLVVAGSYSATPALQRGPDTIPILLTLLRLRFSEAEIMLGSPRPNEPQSRMLPWKIFEQDFRSNSLVALTTDLATAADRHGRNADMNSAISWHALCMALAANLPLLEAAAGRAGPAAAARSPREIPAWASTPSARRSAIHAAHIFYIILHRRFSEPIRHHSITALFHAALVLGFYIFAAPAWEGGEAYDLYEEVDWAALKASGISDTPLDSRGAAVEFISGGGRFSLAHCAPAPGYTEARRCWLHFASLMEGLGRWRSRVFSRVLHAMCDGQSDVEPDHGR